MADVKSTPVFFTGANCYTFDRLSVYVGNWNTEWHHHHPYVSQVHPKGEGAWGISELLWIEQNYNNVLVSAYFVDSTAVKIMFSWAMRSFTWEVAGNIIFRLRQQHRRTQPNGFCVSHCTIYSKMANEKVELVLSLIEHSRIGLPSIAYKQTKDFNMLPHLHKSSLAIGWAAKF